MILFRPDTLSPRARGLLGVLRDERVAFDLGDPRDVSTLEEDAERIAGDMDAPGRAPPMLWSGIPLPSSEAETDSRTCLSLSIGGTDTKYLLLRLQDGTVVGIDRDGHERSGDGLIALRDVFSLTTPTVADAATGQDMVDQIVAGIGEGFSRCRGALDGCEHVLLSWGFPSRTVRTARHVLGGLTAVSTLMTKAQAPFTDDLLGKDIGALFERSFERQLGWSRRVTVANDTVMALHYFLTRERRQRYGQIGLFINGTGTNFSLAEPYGVRAAGVTSARGEEYEPRRITPSSPREAGEREERFFVNYEAGSVALGATRTRYDTEREYPFERNAIAGGNAFEQQFCGLIGAHFPESFSNRLLAGWLEGPLQRWSGPIVSRISGVAPQEAAALFPGANLPRDDAEALWLCARTVVARSALHVALVLAAVTRRTAFGLGDVAGHKNDLLGMEGSVWRSPDYPELVVRSWQKLIGERKLQVALEHEPSYDASVAGPVYLALLHV